MVYTRSGLAPMLAPNATTRTCLCASRLLRVEENTLYHELHDTEVAVLGMIRQGMPRTTIQQAVQDLCKNGTIDAAKEKSLLELVQSLSGGLLDTDKISFSANAQFIAKASQNAATQLTPQEALMTLKQLEEKFCKLWDDASGTYRPYGEIGRNPPIAIFGSSAVEVSFGK